MTTELIPTLSCNLGCEYCYQNSMRDAGNHTDGYDMDAMLAGLEAEGERFTLFGGEALLMPLPDMERLFQWGFKKHGGSSVQTNATLLTLGHLELFRKYNVSVGISADGPDELNDVRSCGTLEKTRAATDATMKAIAWLCALGSPPGLIVTLHRGNAAPERLTRLICWLRELDQQGVTSVGLHLLEVDDPAVREKWALSEDENIGVLLALMAIEPSLIGIKFDLFRDMAALLTNSGAAKCIWGACDPLTTPAVRGVNGTGAQSNCGRTNKDGVNWIKASAAGAERYLMLHATPQADGGCQGCRFFFACKGQCPGTAMHGDWRNRSEHCRIWYRLLQEVETRLRLAGKQPISWDPKLRGQAETALFEALNSGTFGRDHGDHWDAPDGYEHDDNGFTVHGDKGVTRTHGDHNDQAAS